MSEPRTSPSIFTRGAVDLGALRPSGLPSPASGGAGGQAAPADQPAPSGGGFSPAGANVAVIDVSEATFQTEVLERSMTTPVIIDFWAEWCEPCKQLSPVLEKLAAEGAGAWVLARIDVDANQRLAQMFRVQGIPMVFAVVGGQPVDAFSGVVPEAQLRQWIGAVLKAGGVEVETPADPRLESADDAMMVGDLDAAEAAYKKILFDAPADAAAEAGLAQVGLFRRVQGVDAAKILTDASTAPDDIEKQMLAADVEVLGGEADRAYRRLIDLVRRSAGDDKETVRKHLVSLFTIAGPDDAAVSAARRSLASALY